MTTSNDTKASDMADPRKATGSGSTSVSASTSPGKTLSHASPTSRGYHSSLSSGVRHGILIAAVLVGVALSFAFGWGLHPVGIIVLTALVYMVAIYAASRSREGQRHAVDRLVTAGVTTMFALALVPLVSVVIGVVQKGMARFDAMFFTNTMRNVLGEGGGAYHAVAGTLIITAIATIISVPIGILAAIYLTEYGNKNRLSRALTFFVDVMTGIPSIVAGLFAFSLFVLVVGPGYKAGIVGAVSLVVLMIPTVVRNTEEMLRIVPRDLREASYALGVPKWLTITKVVLPTALAGIATGVTLAIARVIGETAPLLITVGTADSWNVDPLDDRMATLPVFAYYQYMVPGVPPQPYYDRAWAAALTLIIIVMGLNILARLISKVFAPKAGR